MIVKHPSLRNIVLFKYSLIIFAFLIGCQETVRKPGSPSTTEYSTSTYSASSYGDQSNSSDAKTTSAENYTDGLHCAFVKYHNPNSGTISYYKLPVFVVNGRLARISWANGGWLDETHFDPPTVDLAGRCSFVSDKGYLFEVLITDEDDCKLTDASSGSFSTDGATADEALDEDEQLKQKYGDNKAVVYKRFQGCDYMILEYRGSYVVAEWMGGYDPDEGEYIQGEINRYGTRTFYIASRERESRLWVDDYLLSESSAYEKIGSRCD